MASFDNSNGRSRTNPAGVEDGPGVLQSPISPLHRTNSPGSQTANSLKSKRSLRPVPLRNETANNQSKLAPIQRFRMSVRKVMHLNKTSSYLSERGPGAEPGIDVRKDSALLSYGHIRQNCSIEIADYSTVRSSFRRMTNREFISFLNDPAASERERWVKIRWINVGGISWDVVRALALKYDLHPLSLESLLHVPGPPRSGADYYKKHLFIRVLSHSLNEDGGEEPNLLEQLAGSPSTEPFELGDEVEILPKPSIYDTPRSSGLTSKLSSKLKRSNRPGSTEAGDDDVDATNPTTHAGYDSLYPNYKQGHKIDKTVLKLMQELKEGGRLNVAIKPVCIFLFKDGTVISIHPDNDLKFTEPIRRRLTQRDTGLRSTADGSLLVHGLLDLVVDSALGIVDAYQRKIVDLERQVLLQPKMTVVKQLHIISGDLILHKRTLGPIQSLIYGIRRYDVDRTAALYDPSEQPKGWRPEGYVSDKAKTYLADVHDHMEYILANIEMFAGIAENLIEYSFNMSSHEMNEVMRILTLVTVLFAPLTVLAGYFGMNFDLMWSVHGRSDILYWEIAIPMTVVIVLMFFWTDLTRSAEHIKKVVRAKKIDRANV